MMEININLNSLSKKDKSDDALKTAEGKREETAETKERKASESLKGGLKAAVIFSYGKQAVTSIASSRISSIGSTYGDEALQNRVSNVYSNAMSIGSSLTSIAVATTVNPALGAIMAGLALLQRTIGAYASKVAWDERRKEESIGDSRRAERLGIVASGSSRRNY